ncbi:MAG: histidine kinase [Bacteroidia bacterium]|nr:histidine kinase [Bacteroidia bacterium]
MRVLLQIIIILSLSLLQVRQTPQEYQAQTDSLILKRPVAYASIDQVFKKYRNDTLVLNYLKLKSRRTNYAEGLSYSNAHLAQIYHKNRLFTKAHVFFMEALEAADRSENPEYKVNTLVKLGRLHEETDSLKTAIYFYEDALSITDSLETFSVRTLLNKQEAEIRLGDLFRLLQNPETAKQYYNYALDSDLLIKGSKELPAIHLRIGQALKDQDSLESALIAFRKSRAAAQASGDSLLQNWSVLAISDVLVETDRFGEASELFATMSIENEDQHIDFQLARMLLQSKLVLKTGASSEARKLLSEALDLATITNNRTAQAEIYLLRSELERKERNFEAALSAYSEYHELQNELQLPKFRTYLYNSIIPNDANARKSELQLLTELNELTEFRLKRNQNTFLITGLLFALLTLVLYIIYRQYQLRNERKVVSLEQTMLRSQMNPHFLFNSLNSIKHYIINNEQKNAVHYLNKFSKLVRRILEASSARETTLSEELETVELYMNIENIRFSYEIDFQIHMDEQVDPDHIRIPSLILQPFLENALWHGLSSKKGTKKIDLLVVREDADKISIEIRDNGVGRAASQKMKESRVLKRKSLGIDITKERLQNFAKDYQNSFAIQINDLVDPEGNPEGTSVMLHIPTI